MVAPCDELNLHLFEIYVNLNWQTFRWPTAWIFYLYYLFKLLWWTLKHSIIQLLLIRPFSIFFRVFYSLLKLYFTFSKVSIRRQKSPFFNLGLTFMPLFITLHLIQFITAIDVHKWSKVAMKCLSISYNMLLNL